MYTLKLTIQSLKYINHLKQKLSRIVFFLKNKQIKIKGSIKPKKKNTIYTVLRSPTVYKNSREHFNYNIFKQSFFISNQNLFTIINFLIIFKKILPKNILLKIKIIKN